MSISNETDALKVRYTEAKIRANKRAAEASVDFFEEAVDHAEAVLCRPFQEISRLAFSDHEIYSTFYQRVDAGARIPDGDIWDRLRAAADTHLFGENKKHVRFAALSLDGKGLDRYGECCICLKSNMIEHRASLIEENSVVFMKKHKVSAENDYALPLGYRATWLTRAKLAVAKLADAIRKDSISTDFPGLLLTKGKDGWTDKFLEVHIWGPLSMRSVRQLTISGWRYRPRKGELTAFRERLQSLNIRFIAP